MANRRGKQSAAKMDVLYTAVERDSLSISSTMSTTTNYDHKSLTNSYSRGKCPRFSSYSSKTKLLFPDSISLNSYASSSSYFITGNKQRIINTCDNLNGSLSSSLEDVEQKRLIAGASLDPFKQHRVTGSKASIASKQSCTSFIKKKSYSKPEPNVNIVNLKLSETKIKPDYMCRELPKRKKPLRQTRATQSIYRVSSAQTLPYLPNVANDLKELQNLEIFKLAKILPGDGPPGLYEVEILERARKRWAFAKAIKKSMQNRLQANRAHAELLKHTKILEAFEWEHWIEREEYIQECQMLRLEILIRMFNKREKEMHDLSKKRIQTSYERIHNKRQADLKKNQVKLERSLRFIESKHKHQSRIWQKGRIAANLSDPSSEFYAPQMRYGVNPNRRHIKLAHNGFDMRIDDLEKRAVKMHLSELTCPYAKLKEWSKPKQVLMEVEQNFCSEVKLQALYESLTNLRYRSQKHKIQPQCLKEKIDPKTYEHVTGEMEDEKSTSRHIYVRHEEHNHTYHITSELSQVVINQDSSEDGAITLEQMHEEAKRELYLEELKAEMLAKKSSMRLMKKEVELEEFESVILAYEGNTIGWLMRFLGEEMQRIKEQRKLHNYCMQALRERWRREAAEAGMRQKENYLRSTYEKIYDECNKANLETAEAFLREILDNDIADIIENDAVEHVQQLGRDIDQDVKHRLDNLRDIQNPLNYDEIRYQLRDALFPNPQLVIENVEKHKTIDYIIHGVLLPHIFDLLEPYDISVSITNNLIDRLIDNDLYLVTSDESSQCNSAYDYYTESEKEAEAILRKLIRYSVPGRRWLTTNERIADNNINNILDDIFERVHRDTQLLGKSMFALPFVEQSSHYDVHEDSSLKEVHVVDSMFDILQVMNYNKAEMPQDYSKALLPEEKLLLEDGENVSVNESVLMMTYHQEKEPKRATPSILHPVQAVISIHSDTVFDTHYDPKDIIAKVDSDEILSEPELDSEHTPSSEEMVIIMDIIDTILNSSIESKLQIQNHVKDDGVEIESEESTVGEITSPKTIQLKKGKDGKEIVINEPKTSGEKKKRHEDIEETEEIQETQTSSETQELQNHHEVYAKQAIEESQEIQKFKDIQEIRENQETQSILQIEETSQSQETQAIEEYEDGTYESIEIQLIQDVHDVRAVHDADDDIQEVQDIQQIEKSNLPAIDKVKKSRNITLAEPPTNGNDDEQTEKTLEAREMVKSVEPRPGVSILSRTTRSSISSVTNTKIQKSSGSISRQSIYKVQPPKDLSKTTKMSKSDDTRESSIAKPRLSESPSGKYNTIAIQTDVSNDPVQMPPGLRRASQPLIRLTNESQHTSENKPQ